jgi:hypothetical protein
LTIFYNLCIFFVSPLSPTATALNILHYEKNHHFFKNSLLGKKIFSSLEVFFLITFKLFLFSAISQIHSQYKEELLLSHDIYLYNKAGNIISHVRFTMGDVNAIWFYDLFDAQECNGGVSGLGRTMTLLHSQMENAYKKHTQSNDQGYMRTGNERFDTWQQNEILTFLKNGIETAKVEGKAVVGFF